MIGELPPAPAPIPKEQLRAATERALDKILGPIRLDYLVSATIKELGITNPHMVGSVRWQVRDYVVEATLPNGWLKMVRTFERKHPIAARVTSKVTNEKACGSCGRMNDCGVSKCWCCEASNP